MNRKEGGSQYVYIRCLEAIRVLHGVLQLCAGKTQQSQRLVFHYLAWALRAIVAYVVAKPTFEVAS